jgi:hypothetical protein
MPPLDVGGCEGVTPPQFDWGPCVAPYRETPWVDARLRCITASSAGEIDARNDVLDAPKRDRVALSLRNPSPPLVSSGDRLPKWNRASNLSEFQTFSPSAILSADLLLSTGSSSHLLDLNHCFIKNCGDARPLSACIHETGCRASARARTSGATPSATAPETSGRDAILHTDCRSPATSRCARV